MKSIFDYEEISVPEDCIFKISPSSISKFFDYPSIWYKENVLKEEKFEGNTSTIIGTICHYIYECVAKGIEINREIINEKLDEYALTCNNPNIDFNEVKNIYPSIAMTVVNEYLLKNKPTETELPMLVDLGNGIYLGGTCDNITGSIVCDYKNVSTKPNETVIPFGYKIQLLAYAYMVNKLYTNKLIDRIRIVYGVRPTKTLPSRCFSVTEQISYEDWNMLEDTLKLISESIIRVKEDPTLTHLIFKSMSLKGK